MPAENEDKPNQTPDSNLPAPDSTRFPSGTVSTDDIVSRSAPSVTDSVRAAPEEAVRMDLGSDLDPAHRALADALRLSFRILKGVMALLVVGFLLTGFRSVKEQQQGIRITFGKMESGGPLTSGAHASWPAPVGEFLRIETAPQTISLDDAFWIKLSANEKGVPFEQIQRRENQGLVPNEDGSIITSDHNLAHTRWKIVYHVRDARTLIENISQSEHVTEAGSEADLLVRKSIDRAVVHAAAETPLDDVISSREAFSSRVKASAQQLLNQIGTGIDIDTVSCINAKPPRPILGDYQAVNQAVTEANHAIETAREQATQTLNAVAGSAYRKLSLMLQIYEALSEGVEPNPVDLEQLCLLVDNPDEIRDAASNAEDLLKQIDDVLVSPEVGGTVATIIADARQYSTGLVAKLDAETRELEAYYPEYKKNPLIVKTDLWRTAMKKIFNGTRERFLLSPDTTMIDIRLNRDPLFKREQDRKRARKQLEESTGSSGP